MLSNQGKKALIRFYDLFRNNAVEKFPGISETEIEEKFLEKIGMAITKAVFPPTKPTPALMNITIADWSIYRDIRIVGDPVVLGGTLQNHPKFHGFANPGKFKSFNRQNGLAISFSGKMYQFDTTSFQPTDFAKTVEDAFTWIENNWMAK